MRLNWEELKKEYILGEYKSVSEFGSCKGLDIKAGNFKKQTKGWAEEKAQREHQKSTKTIEKTIEKVTEKEADRNSRHIKVWDKILDRIDTIADKDSITVLTKSGEVVEIDVSHQALMFLATAMEKAQKGHRLAEGMDDTEKGTETGVSIINDIPRG